MCRKCCLGCNKIWNALIRTFLVNPAQPSCQSRSLKFSFMNKKYTQNLVHFYYHFCVIFGKFHRNRNKKNKIRKSNYSPYRKYLWQRVIHFNCRSFCVLCNTLKFSAAAGGVTQTTRKKIVANPQSSQSCVSIYLQTKRLVTRIIKLPTNAS